MLNGNPLILRRLDVLITEGERILKEFEEDEKGRSVNWVPTVGWITSCLNLLDKLSVSTNRFVKEFEAWIRPRPHIEAALGGCSNQQRTNIR
jgi:hypothetical protein